MCFSPPPKEDFLTVSEMLCIRIDYSELKFLSCRMECNIYDS